MDTFPHRTMKCHRCQMLIARWRDSGKLLQALELLLYRILKSVSRHIRRELMTEQVDQRFLETSFAAAVFAAVLCGDENRRCIAPLGESLDQSAGLLF